MQPCGSWCWIRTDLRSLTEIQGRGYMLVLALIPEDVLVGVVPWLLMAATVLFCVGPRVLPWLAGATGPGTAASIGVITCAASWDKRACIEWPMHAPSSSGGGWTTIRSPSPGRHRGRSARPAIDPLDRARGRVAFNDDSRRRHHLRTRIWSQAPRPGPVLGQLGRAINAAQFVALRGQWRGRRAS